MTHYILGLVGQHHIFITIFDGQLNVDKVTTTKLKPEYASPKLVIYGNMVALTASGSTGRTENADANGSGNAYGRDRAPGQSRKIRS